MALLPQMIAPMSRKIENTQKKNVNQITSIDIVRVNIIAIIGSMRAMTFSQAV